MRLRLFARLRRSYRPALARDTGSAVWAGRSGEVPVPAMPAAGTRIQGRHRRDAAPGEIPDPVLAAGGQPLVGEGPLGSPVRETRRRPGRLPGADTAGRGSRRRAGTAAARAAIRLAPRALGDPREDSSDGRGAPARSRSAGQAATAGRPGTAGRSAMAVGLVQEGGQAARIAGLPWYEVAHARRAAEGQRDCGEIEAVLYRQWDAGTVPPPEAVRAIDRLAELPSSVRESLAAGLDAIYVGAGGVPDLDDMTRLHGVPLPSGRATWDACAGAYGERKIVVGSRPSAAPDVMCHEVGHALDDIDGSGEEWQSDSDEFRALYGRCLPRLVSDFHRQEGVLGRREFFADAFSAIASRQRPALVDMLGGDTRIALDVMLYFNVRYGI